MQTIQALFAIIFPALVIVAALKDVTSFTIPNWISAALVVAFVPAAFASGMAPAQIGLAFAAGLGALVLGMGMFAMNWIGGGDAKLLAAAVLWIGLQQLLPFLLVTGLAGGALALLLLQLRSAPMRPLAQMGPAWINRLAQPGEHAPYGVAIAIGALVVFPRSAAMAGLMGLQ